MFGKLKPNDLKTNPIPLSHDKVISNQEFNNLDGSHNSNKIIQTGNYRILIVQQEIYETNSTDTDEVILVKHITTQIRGGDLGKASSPGAGARSDARKVITNKSKPGGSSFAEAWPSHPSKRSRPAAVNRVSQQFQVGLAEGENGLFG